MYLSIWIDSKPIVYDSSCSFTDNSDKLTLGLTRFLLKIRTQGFCVLMIYCGPNNNTFELSFKGALCEINECDINNRLFLL